MNSSIITLLIIGALLLFWAVGAYNRLVRLRNEIGNAFAQIDVQLKRRHDLIPNLVEVSRKYMEHERETLERVTAARAQVIAATDLVKSKPHQAGPILSLGMAEGVLSSAMGRFNAVMESYPELKADQRMKDLSEELTHTENKVAFARQAYNDAVTQYNTRRELFPDVVLAGMLGFTEAQLFEIVVEKERDAPKVSF